MLKILTGVAGSLDWVMSDVGCLFIFQGIVHRKNRENFAQVALHLYLNGHCCDVLSNGPAFLHWYTIVFKRLCMAHQYHYPFWYMMGQHK